MISRAAVSQSATSAHLGHYALFNVDAFDWLARAAPNSIHAVVTDPPYGAT